ncbi:Flp family type IVb pilin [Asticcacaulis sp.]|uniref:Flp family type IVb pilin n=1 Tax=Asticcacaulis sp. TaxID=1872648 RepID=UPI0031DD549B
MDKLKAFWMDESGTTAIEYGLIAAILFLGISGAVMQWGESFKALFSYLGGKIGEALSN